MAGTAPQTISAPTTSPLDSLQGLYDLINGKTTTQSGGTQTKTESSSISQEGMNEMLKSALAGTSGLAAVAGGQRTAGGYGSATNQLLVNDLMTRTAGQIAQANSSKTTAVSSPGTTTTQGGVSVSGTAKLTALLGGLNQLDKSASSPWLKKLLGSDVLGSGTSSGGSQEVYSNPANETGNTSLYSTSGSNMVDTSMESAPLQDSFSSVPAQDFSSLESLGIDSGSISSSPAMEEDPLLFLGLADGGQVTEKKPSLLGTSQYNQVREAANSANGLGVGGFGNISVSTDNRVVSSGSSDSRSGGFNGTIGSSEVSPDAKGIVSDIGTGARMLGTLSGNPSLGAVGTVLGVASSANPLASAGLTAANIATKGLAGAAFGLAKNPSLGSVIDIAGTISNPLVGVANTVLGWTGLNSLGTAAENAFESSRVDGPTRVSEAFDPITQSVLAQQQDVANNPPEESPEIALENLIGTPAVSGHTGNYSFNGYGDRGPGGSSGDTGASAGGATAAGPGGYADGSLVQAPGDGTTDTRMVPLANGEYVLPADVVAKIGVDKLDALKDKYHTPVAVQRLQKFGRG